MGKERREVVFDDLNVVITAADFTLILTVIDKYELKKEKTNSEGLQFADLTARPVGPLGHPTISI